MVEAFCATATVMMVQRLGLYQMGFSGIKCCHQPNISEVINRYL